MSVKRDIVLITSGDSGRAFQKYTSVTGRQLKLRMWASHMTKLRSGATARQLKKREPKKLAVKSAFCGPALGMLVKSFMPQKNS